MPWNRILLVHMFKYNLTNTPTYSQCLLAPEDNLHYFFHCPAHKLARQHFLNLLQSELDLDTSNIKHTLELYYMVVLTIIMIPSSSN